MPCWRRGSCSSSVPARWFSRGTADEAAGTKALASRHARIIASKAGQRGTTKLDDGSGVAIGASSEIIVPPGFVKSYRTVKLTGAASFTVASGGNLPFKVRAGNTIITPTGTLFDVSAFADDGKVVVRVREGSMTVEARGAVRTVGTGAGVVVSGGDMIDATEADVANAFAWTDGQLKIVDLPLKDVVPLMHRWYGLVLTPENKTMLERRVTMSAGLDSMRAAIRELQTNGNVMIDYDGKKNYWEDVGTIASYYQANLQLTDPIPAFDFYDSLRPVYTQPRHLPATRIEGCALRRALVSEGCILMGAEIERSVVGIRSRIGAGACLRASLMLGADFYETLEEIEQARARGLPPVGVGEGTMVERAVLDKNARIGRNVRIVNQAKVQNADGKGYYIRDGIVLVPKGGVIPDETVI